jgi:hypothetical protein
VWCQQKCLKPKMRTEHFEKYLEAYLDQTLPAAERLNVAHHLARCAVCRDRLEEARLIHQELGPVLRAALGQPRVPPHLRQQIKQSIENQNKGFRPRFGIPLQLLNAAGTVAVIAVLAIGAYTVIQGQITTPPDPVSVSVQSSGVEAAPVATAEMPTATVSPLVGTSLGDRLPQKATKSGPPDNSSSADPVALPTLVGPEPVVTLPATSVPQPGGTIAFPLFDGSKYQTYLVQPDGSSLRPVPLFGVSEPALHPGANSPTLVIRSWNDPDGPRTLLTTDLEAQEPRSITHFWEDAQPDWSPNENRIIFASQRESDRRWRLYSAWGDGSLEQNLRRQGRSPTFAPDGHRFAFESCDETGDRCGLWLATLSTSEFEAHPILMDPQAKSPDWSPVSDEVVYMTVVDGQWDLFSVEADGSARLRLTDHPANDGLPVWSPDGEWLAFVSDRNDQWGLWVLHLSSGKLQQVTVFEAGTLAAPARLPYNAHEERHWSDEQISWGP